ncbi:MAG TPA: nitronate monooxygenase [Acidimicrobiales bacterium]|nr:nitronate monooxygenase [Acidimicrobiales bacterium]
METRFTELVGCRAPLQLAGMGEVGTPELAAAVSGAGGLGMIGVGGDPLVQRLDALERLGRPPWGVNFLGPFLDVSELELAAARSRVIEIFWREPDAALVGRIHSAGALASWQVGSLGEARAAAEVGCDMVVAQGVEAGGHVRGTVPLLALLDAVLGAIGESTVVVASGGIGSARSVAAALAAGADAVRVGTRFVASAESRAHPEYKRALVDAAAGETVLSDEYGRETGWPDAPNRVLRRAYERAAAAEPMVGRMHLPGRDEPVPIPRFSPLPPTDACEGEITAMALYAGESVGAVRDVRPAAEIVRELLEGAEASLRSARRR